MSKIANNIKQKYRDFVTAKRKALGGTIEGSGEIAQLDNGKCTFCKQKVTYEFSQFEKMIVFITSIKSNPMASNMTASYNGWLIGYLRDKFCPDVTVQQCQDIVHSVSHLKDIALEEMHDAQDIAMNIGEARFELFENQNEILADNDNCTCKCHKEGKKYCDNCSAKAVGHTQNPDGTWHLGLEEKQLLYAFAKDMGKTL